ncbi:hypothetical protein PCYB_006210 [Plasmodium cynomolgi strain B]|uniref:Uncharacterized protein n=1 Tax=Plasmodium cynomolgi (strain B) TaxID=1120755 RepID=K6VKA1_PLACD|nr:hypothetical protein PCYB_006210 [Plasmodium cynomolgi strain B]GAB69872.1 hypothetical protein PCYB_006210 [Plasmodium cynomolgi strain B]
MSEIKKDIEIWQKEYPFLDDVWNTYKIFDNAVEDDKNLYNSLCNLNLENLCVELSEYQDFCKKLMRNLGYFSLEPKGKQLSSKRCYILYNWIYNSIDENNITENIVNKCFEAYKNYMNKTGSPIICENILKYEIYDPRKIILINVFSDNKDVIINTLIDMEKNIINNPRHNFVCECVKIYKEMNEKYCRYLDKEKKRSTCSILSAFKEEYKIYFFDEDYEKYKIPSLDNIVQDLSTKCRKNENLLQLDSVVGETHVSYPESDLLTATEGPRDILTDNTTITHGNVDSPMKKIVTTAISTFAGASLPLALLYKVNTKFYLNICKILNTYNYSMFS